MREEKTISIIFNKVRYIITVLKDKNQIYYNIDRNKKCIVGGSTPIKMKNDFKVSLLLIIQEYINREIQHEIEKINLN